MSEIIQFLPPEDLIPEYKISAMSETTDWGLVLTGIPQAHMYTRGGGIKVAVLDSGEPNHLDLIGNLLPAHKAPSLSDASDRAGHGTHVAGIVAALMNGVGVVGVAPEAKVVPIKVLNDFGQCGFAEIEFGIRLATALKVDIINLSLGAPVEPPGSLHDAIKDCVAKGIIIFAAAGNDAGAVNWPARYPEVIAVGAIDEQGELAGFSSRGPEISVVAPGLNIYSTWLNNQYAVLKGTSQASPFVAGLAALILAYTREHPEVPQIHNYLDMLRALDVICDHQGRVGAHGKSGVLGFGIPKTVNVDWKNI